MRRVVRALCCAGSLDGGNKLSSALMAPQAQNGEPISSEEMCYACFDALIAHFHGVPETPPAYPDYFCPLFVTWNIKNTRARNGGGVALRGCIGTLSARQLHGGLHDFALTSSLRDRRFNPIADQELPLLECTVSLLNCYETAERYDDWEVGKHGLIIDFTDPNGTRRSATYLPEVALHEGWSQTKAINSLVQKAGYDGPVTEELLRSLSITRYQSSAVSVTYDDFLSARCKRGCKADVAANTSQRGQCTIACLC